MNENLNVIAVLLVEDDPGDVVLIREAFEDNKVHNACTWSSDGVEAMAFLRNEAEHADAPRPDLVLLDLNLPRMDGREVLAEVKADPDLRTIPVVVLTTSEAEEDILRSYDLHANAYVTKPVDFERFIEVVRQIDDFFVTVVKLPTPALRRLQGPLRGASLRWPALSETKEHRMKRKVMGGVLTAVAALAMGAVPASGADQGFTARVTNPYYPLLPGMRWEYRGAKDARSLRDVVVVTHHVKRIGGVRCAVVIDRAYIGGRLAESTDRLVRAGRRRHGLVLRRGDQGARSPGPRDEHRGLVARRGRRARQGVFMPAHPRVGQSFAQEHYPGPCRGPLQARQPHGDDCRAVRDVRAAARC